MVLSENSYLSDTMTWSEKKPSELDQILKRVAERDAQHKRLKKLREELTQAIDKRAGNTTGTIPPQQTDSGRMQTKNTTPLPADGTISYENTFTDTPHAVRKTTFEYIHRADTVQNTGIRLTIHETPGAVSASVWFFDADTHAYPETAITDQGSILHAGNALKALLATPPDSSTK